MSFSNNQKLIDEFQEFNWAITYLCFNGTCHVLDDLIEERLQKEINSWPVELRANLREFSKRANQMKDYVKFTQSGWKIESPSDETHPKIMEMILSRSSYRRSKQMQWTSYRDEKTDLYWIIGNMYMPYRKTSSKDPSETDPLSKIDLLKNCKLFSEEFDEELLDNLQELRHALIYGNRRLTSTEKEKYITLMEQLLETPCLSYTSEDIKMTLKRLKSKNVQLLPVELDMLKHFLPNKSSEELLWISQQAVDDCINYALKNLEKTSEKLQEHINKELEEKEFNESVGGSVDLGAAVMAGAGVATGTAAGAIDSLLLHVGAGMVAAAPLFVPAAVGGAIGIGIGCIAGEVGGHLVPNLASMLKQISD